tara:strand:- start:427 stop:759 length:333 start_codon:yes stop_codon:yes gene_type:complete
MEARTKSEWFEMEKPFGEPELAKKYNDKSYWIERIVNEKEETIWFGQGVNWKKTKEGNWTVLGEDENVKPTETFYREDGSIDGYSYPKGRQIWIECEPPIYEKMYLELKK